MSGTQIMLGLGTLVAMLLATKVTVTHAHRPAGFIAPYGQPQVGPDGLAPVAGYGQPQPPAHQSIESEKPLWLIWGQMFTVSELAAIFLVGIFTGGFGFLAAIHEMLG
jgi:hypothetical protein